MVRKGEGNTKMEGERGEREGDSERIGGEREEGRRERGKWELQEKRGEGLKFFSFHFCSVRMPFIPVQGDFCVCRNVPVVLLKFSF